MKRLLTITILFFALTLSAKPRVTGGLSWGYIPQVYRSYSCAYYSGRDGYRINDSREGMRYVRNSYVLLDGGVDFLKHFSVHLQTGLRGVDVDYVVMPMNADFRFFLKGYDRSGLFIGGMAGAALHKWSFDDGIFNAGLSLGYREQLYRELSVDFAFKIEGVNCHPLPVDKYEGVISRPQVLFSNTNYLFVGFGVGINF